MKIKNKFFPYPVLNPNMSDFTESFFVIKNISIENDFYNIEIDLNNNDFKDLIKNNKASFVLHLEESETLYREIIKFNSLNFKFFIDSDKVRRKVELSLFIVANEKINKFTSKDLHQIYNGINISYEKNNIIGYTNSKNIKITKSQDEIKNVESIFTIVRDRTIKNVFELELDQHRILIKVNEKDFIRYSELSLKFYINKSNQNIILLTLLVVPAFVETLHQIKESLDDFTNYYWFSSLKKAFQKKNIDIINEMEKDDFDAYKNVQIIFENVISESLKELEIMGDE